MNTPTFKASGPDRLRAPFPWFGGKSRAAGLIWLRLGEVRNYVEPFFGSGAVLLARPHRGIETVNDADAYLANFWRAVAADPDQVAHWADWPVNEADLHARHHWLVETARERVERLMHDPDHYDAKVAGWWVWGLCAWIGSGWCEPSGATLVKKRPALAQGRGRGVLRRFPGLGLQGYLRKLSDRLRRVRVCCGDFERVLQPAVTTAIGLTGVLLDPPYPRDDRTFCYAQDSSEVWWRARAWAIANGDNPRLRIALCGYERPDAPMPATWTCLRWKATGGYARTTQGKANATRERIWLSPYCLKPAEPEQGLLPLAAALHNRRAAVR